MAKLQRFDEAVAAYDRALALRPEYAEAHSNRGHALADRHDLQESLAAHETALRLRPNSAEFHSNVALALFALDRHVEALAAYDQALALHPGQAAALIGRAEVLLALGRMPEALANADEAITADPHVLNGHLWRARVLILLGMPDAALEATAVARHIAPQDPEAHISHGFALAACNRIEAALLSYDEALQLQPNHIEAQWHRALALLVLGRFQEGWLAYESRNLRRKTMAARKYPQPLWWGQQSLKDQRLYLYWEQGLGDTLHFARYALLAKAAGAQVFLSVQAPLRRVVQGLDPAITILDQNEAPPDFDLHAPLMSLPMAFGTRLETIPAFANGYLSASAEDVARWLPQLPLGRRRIGLVWSGSATHRNDANRADTAGARDEHPAGGGRQRVGGREGHVVGHGPDRLDLAGCADAVSQIEHATRLATGRIDVEQDGRHRRIADGGVQLRGEARVAGQSRFGFQPHGAAHQRAVDRDDGHTER